MEDSHHPPAQPVDDAIQSGDQAATTQFIPFTTLIKRAFSEATGNLATYAWFVLTSMVLVGVLVGILFALSYTLVFTNVKASTELFFALAVIALLSYVALMAVGIVLFQGYFYSVLKRVEQVSFARGCRVALRLFWPIVWVAILSNLVINTGMLLLVIPGIAIGVYVLFISPVVLLEEHRGLTALVRSTHLVHHHWWGVFGRMLGIMALWAVVGATAGITASLVSAAAPLAVYVVVGIVLGLFAIYLLTVTFHAIALMFESLATLKPDAAFVPTHHPRVRRLYFWFAIIGIPATILLSALDSAGEPDPFMDSNLDPSIFESTESVGGVEIQNPDQYGFIE